jgi:hypothetical protein
MGGRVKLRIFPREESYFDLFDAVADNVAHTSGLLLDLVEDFVDPEMKAKRLVESEHEGDRLTHAIYSRLNSTFITPFDREDIHALAGQLDDVVDAMEEAADMMVLHKVLEPLDAVVEQARLLDRAARDALVMGALWGVGLWLAVAVGDYLPGHYIAPNRYVVPALPGLATLAGFRFVTEEAIARAEAAEAATG